MSTHSTATRPQLTVKNKVGLALAALLGLGNVTGPLSLPAVLAANNLVPGPNNGTPNPAAIGMTVAAVTLGLATVVGVIHTWRTANRIGARIVAGTRVISALAALPIFLVTGVPELAVLMAATSVVVTIATVILVLSRPAALTTSA